MHYEDNEIKVADYFVVAGLTDTSCVQDVELPFPTTNHKINSKTKDPITDICIIDKTLDEQCPQGFTCIDKTPSGLLADLNHGSFTAHNIFLCYRRGRDRPPLVDLGVYYEGLETVKNGISIVETTPSGRTANVNNKSGMGSFPIYLTYRRAEASAPQSTLVVTDICVILTNKNEYPPYAYCLIDKNLNKGMIGSSVFLCYKKSMRQVNSIAFKAGLLGRYPAEDNESFVLPATVPLFCLPMGATIECWSKKTKHPLPSFSSFVLTTEKSEKIYGAVVSFYENYPEDKLKEDHKYTLGLLRADGHRSSQEKTIHTIKAICMLSRWPLFDAFRDFLIYLYRLTVSPIAHIVPIERHIAHFMNNVPFPSPQRPRVQYQMSPMHATTLTRPQITPIPLSGASFLALLDDLGADNTLTLITLALTEHKLVVHSLRRAEITRVAEALITLLFPFKWQCTYVPLCPLEMAYVLEAPCPFIVGVDSRYFDMYEPPHDVTCVNLDTNSITQMYEKKYSWKILPKKPAKHARNILQNLFKEIKHSCPRRKDDEGEYIGSLDPELTRTARHMQIEIIIQETILKFMAVLMKEYREYLLPITEAPSIGTTDPSSLFSIQDFIRCQDKASQRFFTLLTGTQLFAAFVEARSFASFTGADGAGKAASLVFFDECIDRLGGEFHDNVRLIEADDTLKSERTVFVMPPDEKGLPIDVGYQYTTFPELQEELFVLDNDKDKESIESGSLKGGTLEKQRRRSGTFVIGRRTKQEIKVTQKQAKLYSSNPQMWARLLLSNTYSVWYGCLTELVRQSNSKAAVLRTSHDILYLMKEKGCMPLPDETCYRVLMHLCTLENKPVLAVRVYNFVRDSGTQLSAITYGLYNKAVYESTWPSSNRDGYMLWQKLRNVIIATAKLRRLIRHVDSTSTPDYSDTKSDLDSLSQNSSDAPNKHSSPKQQSEDKDGNHTEITKSDNTDQTHRGRLVEPPATLSLTEVNKVEQGGGDNQTNINKPISFETEILVKKAMTPVSETGNDAETPTSNNISSPDSIHGRCNSIVKNAAEISPVSTPLAEEPEDNGIFYGKSIKHEGIKQRAYSAPRRLSSPGTPGSDGSHADNHQQQRELRKNDLKYETRQRSASDHIPDRESSANVGSIVEKKSFFEPSQGDSGVSLAEDQNLRNNFDNMTADDIVTPSPQKSRSYISKRSRARSKSGNKIHSPASPAKNSEWNNTNNTSITTDQNNMQKDKSSPVNGTTAITRKPSQKQLIERMDVTHLALDPLSPPPTLNTRSSDPFDDNSSTDAMSKSDSGGRHLLDEIQQYMTRDDPTFDQSQSTMDSVGEEGSLSTESAIVSQEDESDSETPKRRGSIHGEGTPPRKHPPPGLLTRSFTFAPGSTLSSGLMNSGSKLNSLFKATTSKAKQLATSFAKDINNTVQSNLAYYTPEKFKGSLSELTRDEYGGSSSHLRKSRDDLYSSQSSIRSSDSKQSGFDITGSMTFKGTNEVDRRKREDTKHNYRPVSYPSTTLGENSSHLEVPGSNMNTAHLHLAASINSLNTKGTCELDITLSSCSKCQKCESLVYDEEIMAGWMADESNLNTHCPFCNSLFVPVLHIDIKDYRRKSKKSALHTKRSNTSSTTQDDDDLDGSYLEENISAKDENESMKRKGNLSPPSISEPGDGTFTIMEPINVPYLSPLVLRKELESMLENEGTRVLGEPDFVDHHPIVYWNFVWYFRRLNLHSNLYNLILKSNLVNKDVDTTNEATNNDGSKRSTSGVVVIHIMWDNLKLHEGMAKPPLYWSYLQMCTPNSSVENHAYSLSFLENMKQSIKADDVRGPLVALLNEFSAQNYTHSQVRRSAYREILFLIIVALGKNSIDIDAYDRVYNEAFDSLTMQELGMTRKCDKPPRTNTRECRNIFGELNLL
ncbi:C-myc promoter-binding protein-like [Styela clava]